MINELANKVHQNAKNKGFYDGENHNVGEKIALIHSEASEVLEADRKDKYTTCNENDLKGILEIENDTIFKNTFLVNVKDNFEDELADIVIRVMDLAAWKGIDLETHVKLKHRFNTLRPHKHGKKY